MPEHINFPLAAWLTDASFAAGSGAALSPAIAMALVGGINELILEAVEEDRVDRLSELAGPVAAFVRGLLDARPPAK